MFYHRGETAQAPDGLQQTLTFVVAFGPVQVDVPAYGPATDFASTPQKAALHIAGGSVIRTNLWGRYAAVFLSGAGLEGATPEKELILVERFSFGWQPLESLNFRCRLNVHVPSASGQAGLLRNTMTVQDDSRDCLQHPERNVDAGPRREIEAVRRLDDGPLVPRVVVVKDFALSTWYGAGGGPHLFKRSGGRWRMIAGRGGAPDAELLQQYGVPKTSWCKLLSYAPRCTDSSHH